MPTGAMVLITLFIRCSPCVAVAAHYFILVDGTPIPWEDGYVYTLNR